MNFHLPPVYPITDTRVSGLSHAEQTKRLIAGGAELIQIRDKYADSDDLFRSAQDVMKIARPARVKIIINDRVDIAIAVGADGVHLGQEDMPPQEARRLLGSTSVIGYSTHTVEQARAALVLPIDYLAIGPIFQTRTKEHADAAVGLDMIGQVRELVGDRQLVAIGGIGENAPAVVKAGADSAALVSYLLEDPELTSFRLRDLLTRLRPVHNIVAGS